MQNNFELELEQFKGPLATLLELIEKRKLPINEISLSQVADEFIAKSSKMQFNKMLYAEFVSISATLILIKSRTLLPVLEREEDDPESEELKKRLQALSELKQVAKQLKNNYGSRTYLELGFRPKPNRIHYIKPREFIENHHEYIKQIISRFDKREDKNITIKRKKIKSLEEVLKDIERKVNEYAKINFSELSLKSREDKLVAFLAVLELRRKGKVELKQNKKGDIEIERNIINTPYYG